MKNKTIFTSKEQYSNFVSAWKMAVNNSETRNKLTAAHFALYSHLRGKDWFAGFTPITNRNKIANGATPNYALCNALRALKGYGRMAERSDDYSKKRMAELLDVFGGALTVEMLVIAVGGMEEVDEVSVKHDPVLLDILANKNLTMRAFLTIAGEGKKRAA